MNPLHLAKKSIEKIKDPNNFEIMDLTRVMRTAILKNEKQVVEILFDMVVENRNHVKDVLKTIQNDSSRYFLKRCEIQDSVENIRKEIEENTPEKYNKSKKKRMI